MDAAYRHCMQIATSHYENFPVLSWALPRRLRPHVAAVYAFARAADDDADEREPREGAARLDAKRQRIENGNFSGDPVFEALGQTMREFQLPPEPFLDLLSAFKQDTEKKRYETFDEVLDYCRRSANPVGRIVLMLMGYRHLERFEMSDKICTALQLANFWQDVRADYLDRDRIYIPMEDMRSFGVTEPDLALFGMATVTENLKKLIAFEVDRSAIIMRQGWGLVRSMPFRYKLPIALFAAGGSVILRRTSADAPRPTVREWASRILMPFQVMQVMAIEFLILRAKRPYVPHR